jgi:hypothetical protein
MLDEIRTLCYGHVKWPLWGTKTISNRALDSTTAITISITLVNGTISLYNKIIILMLSGIMVTQCADRVLHLLVGAAR